MGPLLLPAGRLRGRAGRLRSGGVRRHAQHGGGHRARPAPRPAHGGRGHRRRRRARPPARPRPYRRDHRPGRLVAPASARIDQRVRTSHQVLSLLRRARPRDHRRPLGTRSAPPSTTSWARPAASGAIGLVPNFAASRVANRFDFRGPAYTVDGACASSLLAVDHAVRELASGGLRTAVLAGAVHHCHVATLWSVFTQLKALGPAQAIRPFDQQADGTLMSEGTWHRRPQAPRRRRAGRRPDLRRHPGDGCRQRRPGVEPDEPPVRPARCWRWSRRGRDAGP